ncbi:MAG: autotransporter-associated beta strand repeat-containing protein [Verrucomicrobiota bacterium]
MIPNNLMNPMTMKKTSLAFLSMLALVTLMNGTAQAQNQTVTMTNNAQVNGGATFVSSNYTNNGTGASTGWTSSSTTGANVLINLGSAPTATITSGTTSSWNAESLNVTNSNVTYTITSISAVSPVAGTRIALGNAAPSTTQFVNTWSTYGGGIGANSLDVVFLTNNANLVVGTPSLSNIFIQLYNTGNNNFDIGTGSTLTVNGAISGSSALIPNKTGNGLMILNGAFSSSSSLNINGGTFQFGSGGAVTGALGTKGIVDNANLAINANNAVTLPQVVSGTGTVTQMGTGTLILNGVDTYSGGTVISSGTIKLGNAAGLGNITNNLSFTGAGTLDLSGLSVTNGALNGSTGIVTNSSGSTIAKLSLKPSGNNSFGGVIIDGATAATALALVSGSTGSQTLSGANTYSGGTTVGGGTLVLGSSTALGSTTAALSVTGGVLNLGGQNITAGAVTMSGGNVTNGGIASATGFTINNSSSFTNNSDLSGNGSLVVTNSSSAILAGNNTYTGGTTIGNGVANGGSLTASSLGSGALALNAATTGAANATLNVATAVNGTLSVGALTLNGNSTSTASLNFQNPYSTITSSDAVNLGGANTTGAAQNLINLGVGWTNSAVLITGTSINGSNLTLTGNLLGGQSVGLGNTLTIGRTIYGLTNTPTTVNLTVGGGAANLNWTGANDTAWNTSTANWYNTGTSSADVFYPGDNVTFVTNAPVVVAPGGVTAGSVTASNAVGTVFTMSGDTVAGTSLTVAGGGTLSAANNFNMPTAPVIVTNASALVLSGSNVFNSITVTGGSSIENASANALGTTTVALNGGQLILDQSLSNSISAGSGGATLNNTTDASLTGNLTGAGGFTKTGAGTLTLLGAGGQTGGLTISSGTVQVGNGGLTGSLGSSTAPVTNNSSLVINLSTNVSVAQNISGSGSLTDVGSATITLSGTNTYTGGTTIANGSTIFVANGSVNLPGNVTNNGSIVLSASSGSTNTMGANISGSGIVNKIAGSSSGVTILTGSNSYTGGTVVGLGTLIVGDGTTNGNITGAINTTLNGTNGTIAFNRSDAITVSNAISGSGTLSQRGTGTLAIGFDNSVPKIPLTINSAGAMKITNANAFGSTLAFNANGATLASDLGAGSTLTITAPVTIGSGATAIFTMPSGQTVVPDSGGFQGGKGTVVMSGQGTLSLNNSANSFAALSVSSGTLQLATNYTSLTIPLSISGGVLDLGGTTQSVASASSFSGGTIQNGTLNNNKGFTFSGPVTFAANLGGSSNTTVNSTVLFSGTNTGYTGNMTVSSGATLKAGSTNLFGTGTTTVSSGGQLDLNGNALTATLNNLLVTGTGSDSRGAIVDNSSAGTGSLAGGVVITANTTLGASNAMVVSANITDTKAGVIGVRNLTVGSGSITLSGNNNFSGNVVSRGATEILSSASALGASNNVTVNGKLNANSGLNLSSLTDTTGAAGFGTVNFSITNVNTAGQDYGVVNLGSSTLTYGNILNLTVGTNFTLNSFSINLFNFINYTGDFAGVNLIMAGSTNALTGSSGIWSYANGASTNWTFTDSTGAFSAIISSLATNVWTNGSGNLSAIGITNNSTLVFANGTAGYVTNNAQVSSLAGITYNAGVGNNTLSGNDITLGSGGIQNNSSAQQTIALNQTLGTDQTFQSGTGGLVVSGNITNAGNTLTVDGSANTLLSGSLSGVGGLTKIGAGSVTLSAVNSFSGNTLVSAGTMIVTGSIPNSALTVASGSKLAGNGTLGSVSLQDGGILSPGDGLTTATLHLSSLNLASNSIMNFTVNGNAADNIVSSGGISFGGNLNLVINGGTYDVNSPLISLFSSGNLSGNFTSVTLSGTMGYTGSLVYDSNVKLWQEWGNNNGNNFYANVNIATGQMTLIPEPSDYALLGLGLLVIGYTIIRRRKLAA